MGDKERSSLVQSALPTEETDYSPLQGGVWDYLRGIYPEGTAEERSLIAHAWHIKQLIMNSGDNVIYDDALDQYLVDHPEVEAVMSVGILRPGDRTALKLLYDEVEAEKRDPRSIKAPVFRHAAA